MSAGASTSELAVSAAEELEDERDFLMRSLDDLELEHESGGIDDESYAALARRLHRARRGDDPRAARRRRRATGAIRRAAVAAGASRSSR